MRILIVDDHPIVRQGLRSLLEVKKGFEICGEAVDGLDAIKQAGQLKPDAVVMDVSMPHCNGLEATREISRLLPGIHIVILSQHDSAEMMRQALNAGARGYVVKSAVSTDLVAALNKIHGDPQPFVPAVFGSAPVNVDVQEMLHHSGSVDAALRQSEERLQREIADLRLLQEISTQLVHSQNLKTLHEKIIDAAVTIMRSDYASMQLLDVNASELVLLSFRGFTPEAAQFWQRVPAESGSTCAAALRTRERVIASDVEECDFMAGTDDLLTYRQTGIRAVQSTPLLSRSGQIVGMISTHWTHAYTPTERDLRVFDLLARQAADILEHRLSEEALRESEQRLRALAEQLESEVRARTEELEQRNKELRQRSEELRELWNRLSETQEEERRHIARELHDSVGQHLAGLSMLLAAEADRSNNIKEAARLVKICTAEIRTISHLLHPPLLEETGLASAVRWYVEGFSSRSGIAAEVQLPKKLVRLEKEIELALFRVLQESLTNVHRHSGSNTVEVRIGVDSRRVWLEVEDRGNRNFNRAARDGVGITGMRERVQNLSGEFSITSNSHGTCVRATLPLLSKKAGSPSLHSHLLPMYEWQQLVLAAFVETQAGPRALKVNAAERAISARLCQTQAPDLNEHIALRDALRSLQSLFPQARPHTRAADKKQSA